MSNKRATRCAAGVVFWSPRNHLDFLVVFPDRGTTRVLCTPPERVATVQDPFGILHPPMVRTHLGIYTTIVVGHQVYCAMASIIASWTKVE